MIRLFVLITLFLLTSGVSYSQEKLRGYENGHEWVDLGLSVKWATCNVGASFPGDYGSYFTWGETSSKCIYNEDNYRWWSKSANSWLNTLTKYYTNSYWGKVDNLTRLYPTDDAARINWRGRWRMPTASEFEELLDNCSWTWTTQNGHSGYKVRSKRNGNSIFLPAAGYRSGSSRYYVDSSGHYWSSILYTGNPYHAWYLIFYSSNSHLDNISRDAGLTVRPVLE